MKSKSKCVEPFVKYLVNYILHGVITEEYGVLGFTNLNRMGKKSFITMRRNRKFESKYNDEQANNILKCRISPL